MKVEITGYITGLVNNSCRVIESMKRHNASTGYIQMREGFKNELSDLLDYVTDIPEAQEPTILNFNISNVGVEENNQLRNIIKDLEESCEEIYEVERNLHKKNEQLRIDNEMWQKACNDLKEKNEKLEEQVKDLTVVLEGI